MQTKISFDNRDWLNNKWSINVRLEDKKILFKENIWYRKLSKIIVEKQDIELYAQFH